MKKLTIDDIKNKLPEHVSINEETYTKSSNPAIFIDSQYGEWKARPNDVIRGGKHPLRHLSNKTLSLVEVKNRLPPHISIKDDTYVNAHTKCIFIDSQYGEWASVPSDVMRGYGNPIRANEKSILYRKSDCIEISCQFNDENEWKKEHPKYYEASVRNSWIEECCSHMSTRVIKNKEHSIEECIEDAQGHITRISWKNNGMYYNYATKRGWLKECCAHMAKKAENEINTIDICKMDALRFETRNEWAKNSIKKYRYARRNNALNECCAHMKTNLITRTAEDCLRSAMKFKTRGEWRRTDPNTHASAIRNGWIQDCTKHMEIFNNRTIEECKKDALNYKTRSEWRKENPNLYYASVRNKWHAECCAHMPEFSKNSIPEKEISEFIKNFVGVNFMQNSKSIIHPLELDIFIPSKKFAIEFNGLYWHSDLYKESDYHIVKRQKCKEKEITLIQINEDEWSFKKDIVKSILLSKLDKNNVSYFARKLELKTVTTSDASSFLEENHLMGKFKAAKNIGLYNKEELVCLMSYKKYKDGIDISRFCNKINTITIGGLSKLLKYIEKNENPRFIQSFVDLRYGTGDSLLKLGFKLEGITPGWKWTDTESSYNRLYCRANMDERKLTEKQHAEELGLVKIYDAGQAKFVKDFTNANIP